MKLLVRSVVCLALMSPLVPGAAHAEPSATTPEAEAHITKGIELRREKREKEALEEFRQALATSPTARARAQVALAEDAMGLWVDAEEALEETLATRDDPWVEKHRASLTEELRQLRTHLADLEIDIAPPGAEVSFNGAVAHRRAGQATFRVPSGRVLVQAKADGYEAAEQVVEHAPASRGAIALSLRPVEKAPPETARVAVVEVARPVDVPSRRTTTPSTGTSSGRRSLVISFVAGAGAAFALGTVAAIKREGLAQTYNDDSKCHFGGVSRAARCGDVAADADRYATIMAVGYASAAALAIVGTVIAITTPAVQIEVGAASRSGAMFRLQRSF